MFTIISPVGNLDKSGNYPAKLRLKPTSLTKPYLEPSIADLAQEVANANAQRRFDG